jgi:hypothetical protein
MLESTFVEAFAKAKDRLRKMEYRYVEETDRTRRLCWKSTVPSSCRPRTTMSALIG